MDRIAHGVRAREDAALTAYLKKTGLPLDMCPTSNIRTGAVETIAEDFHTTLKLHRAGWKSHYHDEVLVQGIAPHDLAAYLLQRDRWARGNLAVFTTPESPLRARELTLRFEAGR